MTDTTAVEQTETCCDCCGEPIDPGTSVEFKMLGRDFAECRHRACCPSVVYVNAYAETLAYGGGEEGGWWYTVGEPLGSIPVSIDSDPQPFIDHLKKVFAHVQVRRKSSIGGQDLAVRIEEEQAEYYPQERPHYE